MFLTKDGILMYCSQSKDGQGDFASIAIKDGRVEFRFDTGSGPAILRSGVPITAGAWYTVSVERKLREGQLKISTSGVNDDGTIKEDSDITGVSTTVTGKSPGSTRGLNIRTPLYFGGTDEQHTVDEGVGVTQGFSGCIADLVMGGVRGGSSGRGRGRGSGGIAARKVNKIVFEKSVVDSSNVLDCRSQQVVDNMTVGAPQKYKGE